MKYLTKTAIALCAAAAVFTSCREQEPSLGFRISTDVITMGAEGGTDAVTITSDTKWTATTEVPWITVSPANGKGNVECSIKVDTTMLADNAREATVRFISGEIGGGELKLRVVQTGFEKMIVLSKTDVELPNYGKFGNRYFDVELTSNVDFNIAIPDTVKWITYDKYSFELDRGSRPRTVKVRFKWESNTRPWERLAHIKITPKANETLARCDELSIVQEAATKIEDNREGDSLAIIACLRALGSSLGTRNEGESMTNWDFITLWEVTDEDAIPENLGRVRTVLFSSLNTNDGIPYEIQFLTRAEEICMRGMSNKFMKNFGTGDELAKLTQLKRLQLFSFGLDHIDDSFADLVNLEVLDLSGNNFNQVPDILTPENFPNLRYLHLGANRRWMIDDMQTTTRDEDEWGGLRGEFPEQLLRWDSLEFLSVGYNLIWGEVPDMSDYEKKYTQEDLDRDTLPPILLGAPKVLPVCRELRINLNLLYGELPEWILYHPHMLEWYPSTFVFTQEFGYFTKEGISPGFSNVPASPEYYYLAYPHKRQ